MKFLIALAVVVFSNFTYANVLKWNCEKLNLKFVEDPTAKGTEFKVAGCWQTSTIFLISSDCKKDPKSCLSRGKNNKLQHPGGEVGSPAFVQCYNVGGRPRFLQVKIKDKWENTSTCFFGSQNSFMDFDTILKNK